MARMAASPRKGEWQYLREPKPIPSESRDMPASSPATRSFSAPLINLIAIGCLLAAQQSLAQDRPQLAPEQPSAIPLAAAAPIKDRPITDAPKARAIREGIIPEPLDERGQASYLVRFTEQPLAMRSSAARGRAGRLQVDAPASQAVLEELEQIQNHHLQAIGDRISRNMSVEHRYRITVNAVAVRLSPDEAREVASLDSVAHVERNYAAAPHTDAGPEWINAPDIWDGSAVPGMTGSRGEGVIIGIVDTGINMQHPSFAEVDAEGYTHTNPFGTDQFVGWCDPDHPDFDPAFECNNKLIGAWDFTGEGDGPEDSSGHGSHVAAIAAGNVVDAAFFDYQPRISGVAHRANLISYDVCIILCDSADVVAAVEQAIADGVHVINESIGIGGDAFEGTKQQAYLGAVEAGVVYVRSAGNSGPNAGTVGPEPPWAISVGSSTHNRSVDVSTLVDAAGITGIESVPGTGPEITADVSADLIDAADAGNAEGCNDFPAGTFTGAIALIDRGDCTFADKVNNAEAEGAVGVIVVNNEPGSPVRMGGLQGTTIPAVMISLSDGQDVRTAMGGIANPQATLHATSVAVTFDNALGDIVSTFSSRGPAEVDVLKPDVSAPGQSILSAWRVDGDPGTGDPVTYNIISGTSMASPHTAGAAALLRASNPGWTVAELHSALMGTGQWETVRKESGADADPFDIGGGRIELSKAAISRLVLNETASGFEAANPTIGGDPRTLNLAGLTDSECKGVCSWTRTLRSSALDTLTWEATYIGVGDAAISPQSFSLDAGETVDLTIDLDLSLGEQEAWNHGRVVLTNTDGDAPDFNLPLAAYLLTSTSPTELSKTVDRSRAERGATVTYDLTAAPRVAGNYTLTDPLPAGTSFVAGSATGGLAFNAGTNTLAWSGPFAGGELEINTGTSPFGYLPLGDLDVTPLGCPNNCDEGGFVFSGLDFFYMGKHYTEAIMSINGTIEVGDDSGIASGWSNLEMPDPEPPNNLLAPLWTDLDLTDSGQWYMATVEGPSNDYHVFEWANAPIHTFWGLPDVRFTFQVWIQVGSDNIWFVYGPMVWDSGGTEWSSATVGAEELTGKVGENWFFDGSGNRPTQGDELAVTGDVETRPFSFQATVDDEPLGPIVNEATLESDTESIEAWATFEALSGIFRDRFEADGE